MRFAHIAIASGLIFASAPAFAGLIGLPSDTFATQWTALPTGHFVAESPTSAPVRVFASRLVPDDARVDRLLGEAIASAADNADRRDIAIYEMATDWDQARRTALDQVRLAHERYLAAEGGNPTREERFASMLTRVGDGTTGRSAAIDGGVDTEDAMKTAYATALDTADEATRAKLEASQNAWLIYRDAFMSFAEPQGPDAARAVSAELTQSRTAELSDKSR